MNDREPLTAPDGTLFLIGPNDVLMTTLDSKEATISRRDLAVLFEKLSGIGDATSAEKALPQLRLKILQPPSGGNYV